MTASEAASCAAQIKRDARRLGFDAVGICDLRPVEREALGAWLDRGFAGTMTYMNRQAKRRREPARIVAGAQRAIVVLATYFQPEPAAAAGARVARYAWGEDYHGVIGDKLQELAALLVDLGSSPRHTRAYVDAGPVPERELAARAGLGWIAKNTMLIRPEIGSFSFIATVFTDLALPTDAPFRADHCGDCRLCLDACPTDAFPTARVLDATRCISYLTIEYRGDFDARQGPLIDDWLFGCDECQDVCPWNEKFAATTDEPRFRARPELASPNPQELQSVDSETFHSLYAGTAFERAKRDGLARNARQVISNGARVSDPK